MADIPFEQALKASQLNREDIEKMTPAEREAYDDLERRIVFGHDSKVGSAEQPVEQGLGSPSHPTRNSIEAYRRWHGLRSAEPDPDFEENLKRMEANLAAYNEKRKARRSMVKAGDAA